MFYTNIGGTLRMHLASAGSSLPANGLNCGAAKPQITFNLANLSAAVVPVFTNNGNLTMNGDVIVNVTNAPLGGTSVLLAHFGDRNGEWETSSPARCLLALLLLMTRQVKSEPGLSTGGIADDFNDQLRLLECYVFRQQRNAANYLSNFGID